MQDGIRFATTVAEREAAFRLRYDLYVAGMGRFSDQADHERRMLHDEYDATARCLIAVQDGKTVGTMRIHCGSDAPFSQDLRQTYALYKFQDLVSEAHVCIAERLMVTKSLRGSTLTSKMFSYVYEFLLKNGTELVLVGCEPHLINHWIKLGFRPFAPPFSYQGVGLGVPLAAIVWDVEHLRKMGSPLAAAVHEDAESHAGAVRRLAKALPETGPVLSELVDPHGFVQSVFNALECLDKRRPLIFDGLTNDDVTRCIERAHLIKCNRGEVVVKEGNAAQTLFILLEGQVDIRRKGQVIAKAGPGAVFGEVAFLLGTPRTADVVVTADSTQILSLSDPDIRRLIDQDASLAAKFLLNLCRCLCARMVD